MSHTKRISRKTRSVRMKRAEPRPTEPHAASEPTDATGPVRMERVNQARALIQDADFDLDGAFETALRRMIESELDNRR
jgi:hypothetical protein